LARKIFFWPIGGRDFDHLCNWFGKSKFPGKLRGSSALEVNFGAENIARPKSPWVSDVRNIV